MDTMADILLDMVHQDGFGVGVASVFDKGQQLACIDAPRAVTAGLWSLPVAMKPPAS